MQKHDREYCSFVSGPLYHPRKEVGGGDVWYLSFIYSILRCRADSLRSHVVRNERLAFYSALLNIYRISLLKRCLVVTYGWCHVKLVPSRCVPCTPYNQALCQVILCKATYVGYMRIYLYTATRIVGRMTVVFCVLFL